MSSGTWAQKRKKPEALNIIQSHNYIYYENIIIMIILCLIVTYLRIFFVYLWIYIRYFMTAGVFKGLKYIFGVYINVVIINFQHY